MPLTTTEPETAPLLTLRDVARRLNVSEKTARRMALRGDLMFVRVAGRLRFREKWIEMFIEKRGRR